MLTARSRRLAIARYSLVTFLFWGSLYLYVPVLPTYVESKTDHLALVGLVLSQYGLWQAVTRFPLGIVADWLGRRKPFILVGIALAGIGALVLAAAGSVEGLAVGRAITGLAAATWVPLTVVFSSLFPPHEAVRATAILTVVGSSGRIVATGLTGSLNALGGTQLTFALAAGVAALAAAVLLAGREPPALRLPRKQPSLGGLRRLVSRRDVLLPSLLSAVFQYVTWAVPLGFLPILAGQLGASPVAQGMLVSTHIVVTTLGSLLAAGFARRFPARSRQLVVGCLLLLAAGMSLAAFASGLPLLMVALVCVGLAHGSSYPVLMGMSIERVAEAERATAMGLHQAIYAAGMFAGPSLSGILADAVGIRSMIACTMGACVAVGFVLVRLLPAAEPQGRRLPPG